MLKELQFFNKVELNAKVLIGMPALGMSAFEIAP